MRQLPVVLASLALAVACTPAYAAQASELRPSGADTPLGDEKLSDERRLTRWAHPIQLEAIRRAPNARSRRIGTLRLLTEDDRREVYLVLQSVRFGDRVWLKIRVPGRPNGRRGWVPRRALGDLHVVRTALLVDRRALRATLRRKGKVIWTSRIGVGAPGSPTPRGRFWIRERLRGLGGIYGPWAFGTAAYSRLSEWPGGGVIGIHGTNQPGLIPGRPSHGCIRVPNRAIRRLARRMPIGTPVRIR